MHIKVNRFYYLGKDIESQLSTENKNMPVEYVDPFWWLRSFLSWFFKFLTFFTIVYIVILIVVTLLSWMSFSLSTDFFLESVTNTIYQPYKVGDKRSIATTSSQCFLGSLGPCNGKLAISSIRT